MRIQNSISKEESNKSMLLSIDMFKTSNLFGSGADEDSEVLSTMAAIAAEAMEQVMLRGTGIISTLCIVTPCENLTEPRSHACRSCARQGHGGNLGRPGEYVVDGGKPRGQGIVFYRKGAAVL